MPSDNFKAAALMTGSMAGYTFNDACMKVLSATMPLEQAVFLRGVATCVLLYVLGRYLGTVRFNLSAREWKLIGFRCIGEIGATYCFLTALFHMPIANVTAILQVLPLVIALAAWVFLSEPLGWRRLAAISVGFIGVLLIIQPGAGFSVWSLYALAAVVFITFRDLVVRKLSPETPSMTVAIMAAISITIGFGIASVGVDWGARKWLVRVVVGDGRVLYLFGVSLLGHGDAGWRHRVRRPVPIYWAYLGAGSWPDAVQRMAK